MTDNVLDFCKFKSDMDADKSHHIATLHIYLNSNNSAPWAAVDGVDMDDVDDEWHSFISTQLRRLAWVGDGMAAEANPGSEPVASISVFGDSRISVLENDDLINTEEQLKWVEEQMLSGVDEIRKRLAEIKAP